MSIVSGIEEYKGLVRLYADGRALALVRKKDFEKLPLVLDEAFDGEEYLNRLAARQAADAYEAALSLLDYADKSEKALTDALLRKGFVEEAARAAAARLRENGIVNDAALARRLVGAAARGNMGLYAIKRKLRQKGLGEEEAESALEELPEAQQMQAARAALDALKRRYENDEPRKRRAKLSQALARRGFSWDLIATVLERDGEEEE